MYNSSLKIPTETVRKYAFLKVNNKWNKKLLQPRKEYWSPAISIKNKSYNSYTENLWDMFLCKYTENNMVASYEQRGRF